MAHKLKTVKVGLGFQVIQVPDEECVNPKAHQNWHIYCPNCNQCGRY